MSKVNLMTRFLTKPIDVHFCSKHGEGTPLRWTPARLLVMQHAQLKSELEELDPADAAFCEECNELWVFVKKAGDS